VKSISRSLSKHGKKLLGGIIIRLAFDDCDDGENNNNILRMQHFMIIHCKGSSNDNTVKSSLSSQAEKVTFYSLF